MQDENELESTSDGRESIPNFKSASVFLTDVLHNETAEWRRVVDRFMEEKTVELQKVVNAVLFDQDGSALLQKVLTNYRSNPYPKVNCKNWEKPIALAESLTTTTCFILETEYQNSISTNRHKVAFFPSLIIDCFTRNGQEQLAIFSHRLTTDILFAVKHLQMPSALKSCNERNNFTEGLTFYENHPEYFQKNCAEFEELCRREYAAIQEKQDTLRDLVDNYLIQQDHYANLEDRIAVVEEEREAMQRERQEWLEEKEKLRLAKQKLTAMKVDLDRERAHLEEEKKQLREQQFDVDRFLEDH